MHFGQFFTSTARIRHVCQREGCTVEIDPGLDYVGLIIRRKESKPFMTAFHRHCFLPGIDQIVERRKLAIKERRAQPRPYRVIQLDPETAKKKNTLVHKLSVTKTQLMLAYLNSNSKGIKRNKATLARVISSLNQPEFVKPYWWRFGENLIRLLEKGVDPLISAQDALNADRTSHTEAIRLLSQDIEADYDLAAEMDLARGNLAASLISHESIPQALLALAVLLETPQELFSWGKDLADAVGRRSDIFNWDELASGVQDTNEQLANYFRTLAGRLN